MEFSGRFHASAALPPVPIVCEAGWAPERPGRYGEETNLWSVPGIKFGLIGRLIRLTYPCSYSSNEAMRNKLSTSDTNIQSFKEVNDLVIPHALPC
jgi:hypothetical protein